MRATSYSRTSRESTRHSFMSSSKPKSPTTYADSGVDIDAGNALIKDIGPLAKRTSRAGADVALGGFGGLFDLKACGFKDPVLDVENFTLTYEDPKNLLIDLKKIGATSGPEIKDSIFLGKSFIQKYKEGYEKFKENNLYPATYEVIYGHAWKSIMTEGQHPIKFK